MKILTLPAGETYYQWGLLHGSTFRKEIAEIAAIRTNLAREIGGFRDNAQVLALAQAHMPILESFDPSLFSEVRGIAEGSGLSEAEIVVVNHYTDLRDIGRSTDDIDALIDHPADLGGCSVIYTPTAKGPLLGQTWDIHGSALPYVAMLRVPEHTTDEGVVPESWVLTITGCVGMAGINTNGVAVTINNLKSLDARVGVLWPALVRKMLAAPTARDARRVLNDAPVGSGHHYFMADREEAFGIETSGLLKREIFSDPSKAFIHTNHCLDTEIGQCSTVASTSTTFERYETLTRDQAKSPIQTVSDLWERFSTVYTNLQSESTPHGVRTCATVVMDLTTLEIWVVEDEVQPELATRLTFKD